MGLLQQSPDAVFRADAGSVRCRLLLPNTEIVF